MKREVTIENRLGLHARPAAEFVRCAREFNCDVFLCKDDKKFSAASILDVLTACLDQGARITIEAEGDDAQKALDRLEQLLDEFVERENE